MKKLNKGYIAFSTLLIISAVTLSVALSLGLLAIGEGQMSLSTKKGQGAFYLADSCLEDALEQIKNSPSYSGGTLNILGGSCTIITNKVGNNWTVTVEANKDNYSKKVQAQLARTGQITLESWKEVE